ncbi:MAG: T9SS type A sorting domain-containing protein, partial [Bacteroidota bacterium]
TGAEGENAAWVITDDSLNILALPDAPPFDLDGAGPGTCLIWHLSFNGDITGAEMGANAADLAGCFSLSNPITVVRNAPEGGVLALLSGGVDTVICSGDGNSDAFDVQLEFASGPNSAWVITDDSLNILALPDAPPFDLDGAGGGTCLIWHLSFYDIEGAEVGANAADLAGCFSLSNAITVIRDNVAGGELTTADKETELTICAGDGISDAFDVELIGAEGENSAWVITDDSLNILALPDAPPFDLEGAGGGTCLIWHLSFNGDITGAEMGANAADLAGCFSLSNPITVIRDGVNGGDLSTADGETDLTICVGDGVSDAFDVLLIGAEGENSAWVITDDSLNILALPDAPPFDLEPAGLGTCLIWHLSFNGEITGAEVGANAADLAGCFSLSNPITVVRERPMGGSLSLISGAVDTTICVGDSLSDAFDVILTGNDGVNNAWVITDDSLMILAIPDAPPFDLEAAGLGTCLIWNLSFDDVQGAEVGANAADLVGCFGLSNAITVIRDTSSAACDPGFVGQFPENERIRRQPVDFNVELNVYPNPASNSINLNILAGENKEDINFDILDGFGRVIYTRNLGMIGGNINEQVDISNLTQGNYILRVRSSSWTKNKLFVKQ